MASITIVDEVSIEHDEAPSDIRIVLTETSPGYNPSYERDELENPHISVSIRPSKEFCVWSVKDIYNGLDLLKEETFCSYCKEKQKCNLVQSVSIPGINITQKKLLEREPKYKTEKTTTHLCSGCFEDILNAAERLVENNTSEIAISKL